MKLAIIYNIYAPALAAHYESTPGLNRLSFKTQFDSICAQHLGWSDAYSHSLSDQGIEAREFFYNAVELQCQWGRENDPKNQWTPAQILFAQLQQFEPTVVLMEYSVAFSFPVRELNERVPSVQKTMAWCGGPVPSLDLLKPFDWILSCAQSITEDFRQKGFQATHLNHAFDSRVLSKMNAKSVNSENFPFVFVGNIFRGKTFHEEREQLLLKLVRQTPLSIFSEAATVGPQDVVKAIAKRGAFEAQRLMSRLGIPSPSSRWTRLGEGNVPRFPVNPFLYRNLKPAQYGLAMYDLLRNAQLALNSHIGIAGNSAANLRLYEATGIGTCLLTDAKQNLGELFNLHAEVVPYDCPEDCAEKARWLIAHPEECRAIAARGQRRTLRDHTYAVRAQELAQFINKTLLD